MKLIIYVMKRSLHRNYRKSKQWRYERVQVAQQSRHELDLLRCLQDVFMSFIFVFDYYLSAF